MTKDIKNLINFYSDKKGKTKIASHEEGNIYKYLRELGFCKSKLDDKLIYYRREGDKVIPSSMHNIKHTFWELLKKGDFSNIPNDIEYSDILNWYLDKLPIKENGLFDNYLEDILTETEAHNYRLETNHIYKRKFEVQQLISKFGEWNFNKTTDTIGAFCKDTPLYYKSIGGKQYLVFSHHNSNDYSKDGFDSWVATFGNEKQIGIKQPLQLQDIRFGFHLDKDFELIKDFVN